MSLAPVLAALVALTAGGRGAAHIAPAQVARVVDGDTISVRLADGDRDTVRLTGVDTPETVHPTQGVEPYGPEAAADTRARLTGATVRLVADPAGDHQDAYGRLLRYVMLPSGEHVNATLIRKGYATAIRTFPYSRHAECLQLDAQARAARRGRWADDNGRTRHARSARRARARAPSPDMVRLPTHLGRTHTLPAPQKEHTDAK